MPNQEDYLDRVWIKVINLDPKGSWLGECMVDCNEPAFGGLESALHRVFGTKVSLEDLGRVFRWVRYEASHAAFEALEDPGLRFGKVRDLHRQLARSKQPSARSKQPEGLFIQALWNVISPAEQDKWMLRVKKDLPARGPFGDVPPSLDQLLKRKIAASDLEAIARWHRYDAMVKLLQLMEQEGFERVSEIPGLHEILLGLEPSGKEARAGSWPFLRR